MSASHGVSDGFDIRALGPDDTSLLKAMLTVFGDAFDDPHTYGDARPSPEYLRGLLSSDSFIALAALSDGGVIGALAAYELRKFEQARSVQADLGDTAAIELDTKLGRREDFLHFDISVD